MPDNPNEKWEAPAERVLALLRAGDPDAAFEYLDSLAEVGEASPAGPPSGFRETAGILYWRHRALPEFVTLSRETARRLEAQASASAAPDERVVRPLAGTYYNLAAFAWPGWDEPGITVSPAELAAGG